MPDNDHTAEPDHQAQVVMAPPKGKRWKDVTPEERDQMAEAFVDQMYAKMGKPPPKFED